MLILQVIDSLGQGGAEASLADVAPHLQSSGVDFHVAFFRGHSTATSAVLMEAGVTLHPVAAQETRPGRVQAVRALCADIQPDLVHTTLFESDIAGRIGGRLARVPVVSSLVNEMYGKEQRSAGLRTTRILLARATDAATSRLVTRFHAISNTVADVMSRRLWIPRSKIDVVYRGRDPQRLGVRSPERRALCRQQLGLGDDTPVVLSVARQEPQKNLDTLWRAFAQVHAKLPAARLLHAGREGSHTKTLRAIKDEFSLGDAVIELGVRSDVPDLLAAADVLAFPSRWEGLGGTILEAMALECPIVCSDIPVFHEALADSPSAIFVDPSDSSRLAGALINVLDSPWNPRITAVARARFLDQFTIERCAQATVEFYERALEANGRKSR